MYDQQKFNLNFKSSNTEEYNNPFNLVELKEAINKSHDTATGPDEVHYQMLKHLPPKSLQPRAGPGVERIGRTPPPLAQSVETWPIGVRLVCRELRPVSLEERILVIERVGYGRHATHYFGLNFS